MLGLGNSLSSVSSVSSASSGWTPADLPNKELWFKYATEVYNTDDPATTTFPSDGGNNQVSRWGDSSGNSVDATDTGGNYPTWDATENALEFAGTSDILELATNEIDITGEFSMFFRIKFDGGTITNTDVVTSDDGTHFLRFQNNKAIRMKIASGPLDFTWPSPMLGTTSYHTIGVTRDSSNDLRVYIDGVESDEGATQSTQVYRVNNIEGGSDVFLKSLIITSHALSSAERTSLTTYLSTQ
jgi:hypothetical protein